MFNGVSLVNKWKLCTAILAVTLLIATVSLVLQNMSFVQALPQRLNVFIVPFRIKLEPLQPQVFSAYSNGSEPVSYVWSARSTTPVNALINNVTMPLNEEPVTVAVGQQLTFAYAEASAAEVCLTVKATDADDVMGYADAKVSDPFTVGYMYLSAFPTVATYIVEADGKGWYWALHKSGLATSGTDDDDIIQYAVNETATTGGSVFVRAAAYSAAIVVKNNVLLVLDYGVTGITYSVDAGATCSIIDSGKVAKSYDAGNLQSTFNFTSGSLLAQWLNAASINSQNYNLNGQLLGFKQPNSFIIDYNTTSGLYQAWHGANSTLAWKSADSSAVFNATAGNLTSGGLVTVRAGSYEINNVIVSNDHIAFVAESPNSVTLNVGSAGGFNLAKAGVLHKFECRGFLFQGNSSSGYAIHSSTVGNYWVESGRITDCSFEDLPAAIYLRNPEEWWIERNWFFNTTFQFILLESNGYPAGNVRIEKNVLNPYNSGKVCIRVDAINQTWAGLYVQNGNHFAQFSSADMTAILLNCSGAHLSNTQIIGNRAEDVSCFVMSTAPSGHDPTGILISNNQITQWSFSNYWMVDLCADSYGCAVDDNILTSSAGTANGIRVNYTYASNPCSISDNEFMLTGWGTKISSSGGYNKVEGNVGFMTEAYGASTTAYDGMLVVHNLAISPDFVTVSSYNATEVTCGAYNYTATTFQLRLKNADGSAATGQIITWYAKGIL